MHGQNVSRPREVAEDNSLQVAEIFYTIQGEGPYSGMPAVFVRLTGCPLRCHFCDTQWDDEKDPMVPLPSVIAQVRDLGRDMRHKLVVITGGEPLRQNLGPLVRALHEYCGFIVQVETAGLYWQECLHLTTIVCSPKTKAVHPLILDNCNHWKYIIRSGEQSAVDGLPNESTQEVDPFGVEPEKYLPIFKKFGMPARPRFREGITVWLSPCDEGDSERNRENTAAVAQLAMTHGYRAQVQLHKILNLR